MEIYLLSTRMFMIMEVNERFSFEEKAKADRSNPRLLEWEQLMQRFQDVSDKTKNGDKWKQMECIFKLEDS
jgi:L-rhamnose mutarotase